MTTYCTTTNLFVRYHVVIEIAFSKRKTSKGLDIGLTIVSCGPAATCAFLAMYAETDRSSLYVINLILICVPSVA